MIAILITLSSAVYQRLTGPTYPLRGRTVVDETEVKFRLTRSHESHEDCEISVRVPNQDISGYLEFRRFKTDDRWTRIPLARNEERLVASLPKQPPAGKLAYKVILIHHERETSLTGESPVIIRFKGAVPGAILLPHVIIMFLAMLFSTRAGIEALRKKSNPRALALWTTGLLFVGGMIFGPLVQKYAFGALWTGFPFGMDLTDNKTLIAMVAWVAAVIAGQKGKPARWWVFGAAAVTLAIYLIPHSLLGSELDYSKLSQ